MAEGLEVYNNSFLLLRGDVVLSLVYNSNAVSMSKNISFSLRFIRFAN